MQAELSQRRITLHMSQISYPHTVFLHLENKAMVPPLHASQSCFKDQMYLRELRGYYHILQE